MTQEEPLTSLIRRVELLIHAPGSAGDVFNDLALELFGFQHAHNVPYQRLCGATDLAPGQICRWEDVPAVVTSAFKEADWTVLPPTQRTSVFYSSGTTARDRSRHFHSPATLALYEASVRAWFKRCVIPDLDHGSFAVLTPPPAQAPNSSLAHMMGTVAAAFGRATYHGSVDEAGAWTVNGKSLVEAARLEEPLVVCGTAFSFVHFCDWAASRDLTLRLPDGSRIFETGGYKGRSRVVTKSDLYSMIARTFSVPPARIISEYGMSELSSQAYDRSFHEANRRFFRFPPWARARVISPETGREVKVGEAGLIRVWDLANVGSVMAVQTEDLGIRRDEGFELAGRAVESQARGCSLMLVA